MNIATKKTIQSKLPGYESVSFTLRKMSEGRRTKLHLCLAPAKATLRDLMSELESLNPAVPEGTEAPVATPQEIAKVQNLSDQITSIVESQINPAWVTWGLDSITGLTIDDLPATVETILTDCPSDLFAEILQAIRDEAELSTEERKN